MLRSWLRRKRFEARLLAAEVSRLFDSAPATAQRRPVHQPAPADRISADEMMGLMGVTWH